MSFDSIEALDPNMSKTVIFLSVGDTALHFFCLWAEELGDKELEFQNMNNEISEMSNAYAAETAEPLGSLEEVEIIDIRRPGDTDAKRDAAEN